MSLASAYQPQNLALTVNGITSVTLTWNAVGGSIVAGYNIRRDGTLLNASPVTAPTYTDSAAVSGHHYNYAVSAVDADGNESPQTPIQRADVLEGTELDWMISWVEQPGMAGRPDVQWNWR